MARIGATAGSGHPGMATCVDGVTLALVVPDFDERMAGLARNVQEQRIGLVMAVSQDLPYFGLARCGPTTPLVGRPSRAWRGVRLQSCCGLSASSSVYGSCCRLARRG